MNSDAKKTQLELNDNCNNRVDPRCDKRIERVSAAE